MNGDFLKYMLSKKKELENSYDKQARKQFWNNLQKIIQSILRSLLTIKKISVLIFSLFIIQLLIEYTIKYTVIGLVIVSLLLCIFNLTYFTRRIKEIGKVRILQSYYGMVSALFIIASQVPNIFKMHRVENFNDFHVYLHFVLIVINSLILVDFIKNQNKFKNKYKYLISN